MADDSWRTHTFRQNVVAKIDEAITASGMIATRNTTKEMENHVYQKAKNKDKYLRFVDRLILHIREITDASWRSPTFRQSIVAKIDEEVTAAGINTSRNTIEMENHFYRKAKNKDEYLGFVARLILHIREMRDGFWRSPTFRQSVVAKIDEAITASGLNASRNTVEMENHIYRKAKSKDEYLGFVARFILHIREMSL